MGALELADLAGGAAGATSTGIGVGRPAAAGVGARAVAHVAVARANSPVAKGGSSLCNSVTAETTVPQYMSWNLE